MGKLFDPDDVELGIDGASAIELYRRRSGLLLVDRTSDLRCGVVAVGDDLRSGFDRPGVLVVASSTHEAVSITVTTCDDLGAGIASHRRAGIASTRQAAWALGLARHRERKRERERERASDLNDVAARIVVAELSRYERVRLDEPPRNLGIFEAPRWVMQSGELVALALRAVGCDLGPAVRRAYPVEHPDLWDD